LTQCRPRLECRSSNNHHGLKGSFMKKLIAVLISALFAGAVFAQATPATPAKPVAGPAAPAAAPAATPAKPAAAPAATPDQAKKKACEAQAKEKKLTGEKRKKFIADCVKA
jgi:hypothetical protein